MDYNPSVTEVLSDMVVILPFTPTRQSLWLDMTFKVMTGNLTMIRLLWGLDRPTAEIIRFPEKRAG